MRRDGRVLTVTLTNDSDRAGTEPVQLYARVDAPETPLKRLCKFVRVRVGAHEERTVRLTADEECFRYFDEKGAERTAEVCELAVGLDSRALQPWLTVWH